MKTGYKDIKAERRRHEKHTHGITEYVAASISRVASITLTGMALPMFNGEALALVNARAAGATTIAKQERK
jgi:hypothetical protein